MTEEQLLQLFNVPEGDCSVSDRLSSIRDEAQQLHWDMKAARRRRLALLAMLEYRHQVVMSALEEEK